MEFNRGLLYAQRVCPIEIIGQTGFVRTREYGGVVHHMLAVNSVDMGSRDGD